MNKSKSFRVKVSGDNACFTRPEMKVERVSYDVMTPSAARGILEAILWKPAIKWNILQIDVLKPIRWESVRRNEVGKKATTPSAAHLRGESSKPLDLLIEKERQQRAGLLLRNVAYVIHAEFEMTDRAGNDDTVTKFTEMFIRRASNGQCFQQPYFGCREFPVDFEFVPKDADPLSPIESSRDLGWMLFDMDYSGKEPRPRFFHAQMTEGSIYLQGMSVRS